MKTFYDYAENDYLFLKDIDKTNTNAYNAYCALSQSVCERYLKHIVDEHVRPTSAVEEKEKEDVLRTHSLRKLCNYLGRYLPAFVVDTAAVYKAEGFYFAVRYPGDSSYFAELNDVEACEEAVCKCRLAVRLYLKLEPPTTGNACLEE